LISQNNTLLEIGDEKINTDEFLYFYNKNNNEPNAMSYNSLKEYMNTFVNFKLKVHDAEEMKMDTAKSFTNELNGYRSKLAQPYLTDKKSEEESSKEYYDRMLFDVDVSHILIEVAKNSPEDTLSAYNKIWDLYKQLQKGADFETLAINNSQDKSVATNNGHLGYYSVDKFVYEFETEMYNTPVGQFSKPFKTSFGYHILKVIDKRPTKGKYKVSHLMKVVPKDISQKSREEAKEKYQAIYEDIKNGKINFEAAVEEYSDDKKTAKNNGEIGWISIGGNYIKEFENAVFSLNNIGDITLLETSYGYHIIKLLDKEGIKPYEEQKNDIKAKIQNTARTLKSKTIVLNTLKNEYKVKTINENIIPFYSLITDSIFAGSLKIEDIDSYTKPILTFSDQTFLQKDFINYIMKFNRKGSPASPIKSFVDSKIIAFTDKVLIDYEETQLEKKYPEFKNIMKEYHDGILLFQIADLKVWGKAIKDTAGIEKFYNENKYNYMWNYRYDVKIFEYSDTKAPKTLQKLLKKKTSNEEILKNLNKKDSTNVKLAESFLCEKGIEKNVDNLIKENNIPEQDGFSKIITNIEDKTVTYISVQGPTPKTISETRGNLAADYQKILEDNWLKELKKQYNITIHDDVLKSLSK
jgi:peptidyl-prolyl cis-trans isomerase SurA